MNTRRVVHGFFLFLAPVAVILFTGCAAWTLADLPPGLETHGNYINGVPFVKQDAYACGPAALASVLTFRGRTSDPAEIAAKIYLPQLHGTLPMDLERYAREAGFTATSAIGSSDRLKAAIRADDPVICLLDQGFWVYRQPHYVTVIGFDEAAGVYILQNGETPDTLMSYDAFDRSWARAGKWMLVVTRKTV